MKKISIFIFISLLLFGCSKAEFKNVPVEKIINEIKQHFGLSYFAPIHLQ